MVRKVLIVEDEPDMAALMAQVLRLRGFDSHAMITGKGAASWVSENRPDVVLLDLMLPDISGYDICKDIKLDRETNLTPVVFVTALGERQDRIHGLQVGGNGHLTKPFTIDQLHGVVEKALEWRAEMEKAGAQGDIHFQLKSDTQYLDELNDLTASLFHYTGLTAEQVHQLTTAVREMGANAIEWGHRKQVDLPVTVTYRIDADKVTIVIRDKGPGFDPNSVRHASDPEDPGAHMELREQLGLRVGGFGILLARGLVDDLQYNETGNEVRLVKHFAPAM